MAAQYSHLSVVFVGIYGIGDQDRILKLSRIQRVYPCGMDLERSKDATSMRHLD
ncbi:capsid protein 3 [Galliform chaphamaparvovirus 16]|nr:capsid protein 3 [Galliform chaphamaparvovirus 16]